MDKKKDNLSKPLIIVSSVIPPVGIVIYFMNKNLYPQKSKKALNSALIGIPIGYIMGKYVIPFLGNLIF